MVSPVLPRLGSVSLKGQARDGTPVGLRHHVQPSPAVAVDGQDPTSFPHRLIVRPSLIIVGLPSVTGYVAEEQVGRVDALHAHGQLGLRLYDDLAQSEECGHVGWPLGSPDARCERVAVVAATAPGRRVRPRRLRVKG